MRTRSLRTTTLAALTALLGLGLAACGSTDYGDPEGVETVTIEFGSTDLQELAGGMSESLIENQSLNYIDHSGKGDDKRVIVYFGGIENRTSEHIDTLAIRDRIRATLLSSGKFRFAADDQGQDEIADQVRFQQGSGRVDPAQAKAFGKQIGADVVVLGRLISIEKQKDGSLESLGTRTKDVYYQFALECVNIETGEIMWADIQDIRKRERTGIFGR